MPSVQQNLIYKGKETLKSKQRLKIAKDKWEDQRIEKPKQHVNPNEPLHKMEKVDKKELEEKKAAMTCQKLNITLQDRVDTFEFPNERMDWKQPMKTDVRIRKDAPKKKFSIDQYHTEQSLGEIDIEIEYLYEEDEHYFIQEYMQQNAFALKNERKKAE